MQITDRTCPRCGSPHSLFGDSYSDGEDYYTRPLHAQVCMSRSCGLPCRLWEEWEEMVERLKYTKELLDKCTKAQSINSKT